MKPEKRLIHAARKDYPLRSITPAGVGLAAYFLLFFVRRFVNSIISSWNHDPGTAGYVTLDILTLAIPVAAGLAVGAIARSHQLLSGAVVGVFGALLSTFFFDASPWESVGLGTTAFASHFAIIAFNHGTIAALAAGTAAHLRASRSGL